MRFLTKAVKKLGVLFRQLDYVPLSQYEIEKEEQAFYIKYLQPGMVVFDVGANIGEITLLFSRFVGQEGRVHSFECSPDTYKRFENIVTLSRRKNISTSFMCLSEATGTAEFHLYDDDHAAWNSLAYRPLEQYGINVKPVQTYKAITTTIDAYCESHDIHQIDLLKIDVEGAEYQVLKGAARMLGERKIRCIVFEFGQTTFDMGNTPQQLAHLIESYGYDLRNLLINNPVFPGGESALTAQYSMHICTPSK